MTFVVLGVRGLVHIVGPLVLDLLGLRLELSVGMLPPVAVW